MKKLISILGITTMGINSLVLPIQNINEHENALEIKNDFKLNEQQNENRTEQWYLKIVNTKQEAIIKNNLLSAITLKDNKINFDVNTINKTLWNDNNIYSIISNPDYEKNLQLMYDLGLLRFIDGKAEFFENENSYAYKGIWAESKWYWFGYWKLHVGHVESKYIINLFESGVGGAVDNVSNLISSTVGKIIAIAASILFSVNYIIMRSYDKGNGIWIGFWGVVPYLGWGSD